MLLKNLIDLAHPYATFYSVLIPLFWIEYQHNAQQIEILFEFIFFPQFNNEEEFRFSCV